MVEKVVSLYPGMWLERSKAQKTSQRTHSGLYGYEKLFCERDLHAF